jgi:hypothetical protein
MDKKSSSIVCATSQPFFPADEVVCRVGTHLGSNLTLGKLLSFVIRDRVQPRWWSGDGEREKASCSAREQQRYVMKLQESKAKSTTAHFSMNGPCIWDQGSKGRGRSDKT